MKISCLVLLPFLFFTSCATITRGIHDKLYVQSEPSGAAVTLSSGERGVTPAKFVKSRKESFSVTVSKAGYIAQTVRVESKMSATGGTAMAGNVIAGGVIGIGIDAGTGAMLGLYPNPVVVRLMPAPTGKPSKRSTTSSARKPASKKSARASSSQPKAAPKPSPTPENFPPIHSAPAPESSPVLQSVPESSPVLQSSPTP